MKKILVLGATGMAGHLVSFFLLEEGYAVTTYSRSPFGGGVNIYGNALDKGEITKVIREGKYDVVINCIGLLNEVCDARLGDAIYLNGYLPHLLCEITRDMNTKIIHVSTDCVFSGKTGPYYENSYKDGETLYDKTKALGEICDDKNLTFRCSIIGPDMNECGRGLFNWFMKQTGSINGYGSVYWTGVTTITLAKAIKAAIEQNLTGLYNLVNNNKISKYALLCELNKIFEKGLEINRTDDIVLAKELINTRKDFSFVVPSYEMMALELKQWVYNHAELYSHYFK